MKKLHHLSKKIAYFTLLTFLFTGCHGAFEADNTITLTGRVTDQANSRPVNAALVQITSPPQFKQSTRSDSTGQFNFEIESEKNVSLSIEAVKDKYEISNRSLSAESGTDVTGITLSLTKSDSTSGGDGGSGGPSEDGPGAAAIQLVNEPPQAINIAQTGELISIPFTFAVQDSAGNPLSVSKAVDVNFEILSGPGGEEHLVPDKATTDDQGQVTTILYSGNKAGEVKIQAVVKKAEMGYTMKSSPILVAIHGGYPDENHFSMNREQQNIEGFSIDNARDPFTVLLGDEFSNPVKPGTIIYFSATGGVMQGSGTTDEDGIAQVDLITGNPRPENGRVTVTASTVDKNDNRIQQKRTVVFSTSQAKIIPDSKSFKLKPGASKAISYKVKDLNGNPMAAGTHISVTADDGVALSGDTEVTLGDYTDPGAGKTEFDFTLQNTLTGTANQSGVTVTITAESPSGERTTYKAISGTLLGNTAAPQPGAASISLSAPPADPINIAATGENISTAFTFQVQDSAGNALSPKRAVQVQFKLTSSPGGDERLVPQKVTTDDQGQAATTFYSGNQAGVAQVQAVITLPGQSATITSEPISVSINGGFPDSKYFNLRSSVKNVSESSTGNLPVVDVTLGDQFSNPVKPGTAVSFSTTGGIIQGSARTDADGKARVSFTDLKPNTADGKVTVTASTVDAHNASLEKQLDLIFSSPKAAISATPASFELKPGASKAISYTVKDLNGNPMAAGTHISVTADDGVALSGDTEVTLDDYTDPGAGKTDFNFTIRDKGTSKQENISLRITVTAPTGTTTTYDGISGARIIEGNEQVGAAAIILTKDPKDFININETGDEVSAPLTFQVRDSLGRPLTSDNAVEVQFKLVSSPGGGESLVPKQATTDGQGNVTTTLFSGNRAGEVKLQARIERPESGLIIKSSPVLIAIHGGFPDKNHFSIAPDKHNFEGFDKNNNRNSIAVVLGDKFSNPVKPGTVVYFETTGGIIQGSGTTDEDGVVEVDLISGDPRPSDGKVTVTASTVNENDVRIQKQLDMILSTSTAVISATPTDFNLPPNGGATFDYTVTDKNGNPMAAGTQISVSAGQGIEVTGDANLTLGDKLQPGPGATEFSFSIRDTDNESNDEADLTILITVTSPSGNTTTYSGIQGVRSKANRTGQEEIQF